MKVSRFENVRATKPKPYDLETWLKETITPPLHLKKAVENYRRTKDKKHKESLPCITVSAAFKKKRNLNNIKKKTGLLCLDIDRYSKSKKATSNVCIDMKLAKELFSIHPATLYCGLSVSGDGVYAIIKIAEKGKLDKYFKHFQDKLSLVGINIDAACKDYTRLRFFSYDKDAYLNLDAKPFRIKTPKKEPKKKQTTSSKSNADKVDAILEIIERNSIDITSDYTDWIKIAGALYGEFGEQGRSYFHRFSKQHSEYSKNKTDKKFNNCKKMNKTNISSLFYISSSYGVRY